MLVVATLVHVARRVGYPVLGALVGLESMGIPLPGETALISASVLASEGDLAIGLVIPIAAGAAIVVGSPTPCGCTSIRWTTIGVTFGASLKRKSG
jgi:membrane protein DedA with SNARE-associated domain